MDWPPIIAACAFLVGLLVVLGFWQRKLDRRERVQVIENIRESRSRNTDKAIAQHPDVDPTKCIGCGTCILACPEDGVLGLVDGIAHIIHGSRCIGHSLCEVACPVGAIKVGLGDISSRPDIPILSDELMTTVPGLFIAGELGGIALIRHAIDQGRRTIDAVAKHLEAAGKHSDPSVIDVLIVGSGPAGLSASLRAVERRLNYVAIDQDSVGGTIRKYPRRKLTHVQSVDIPLYGHLKHGEYTKEELIEMWEEIIKKNKVDIRRPVKLQGLQRVGDAFNVETSTGPMRARTVILALGRRGTPRKLGVPGEDSEKVLYSLIDAATYNGQHVLVVGGGDSAIEAATGLANQPGNKVTLSYRKENFFRMKPRNEERSKEYIENGKIEALFSSEVVKIEASTVTLRLNGKGPEGEAGPREIEIPNDQVFVFAGGELPFDLLRSMGIGFGGDPRKGRESKVDRQPAPMAAARG